jgi:hypothetical protein
MALKLRISKMTSGKLPSPAWVGSEKLVSKASLQRLHGPQSSAMEGQEPCWSLIFYHSQIDIHHHYLGLPLRLHHTLSHQ